MTNKEIRELVYNWPTKYKQGFTPSEKEEVLKHFPDINMEKFQNALFGNTCMIMGGEMITYHCDLELALICGTENRDPRYHEWD